MALGLDTLSGLIPKFISVVVSDVLYCDARGEAFDREESSLSECLSSYDSSSSVVVEELLAPCFFDVDKPREGMGIVVAVIALYAKNGVFSNLYT